MVDIRPKLVKSRSDRSTNDSRVHRPARPPLTDSAYTGNRPLPLIVHMWQPVVGIR